MYTASKRGYDGTSIVSADTSIGVNIHYNTYKFDHDLARIVLLLLACDKHSDSFERIPVTDNCLVRLISTVDRTLLVDVDHAAQPFVLVLTNIHWL